MHFLGIDPGKTGGVAKLSWGKTPIGYRFTNHNPLEVLKNVCQEAVKEGPLVIVLEKVHAFPGQGLSSTFTFGVGFGEIQGCLFALGLEYMLVTPQAWQGFLPPAATPKERVRKYWEGVLGEEFASVFIFGNCRTPDQGVMDAAAMAEYGRRISAGLIDAPVKRAVVKRRQTLRL